MDSAQLYNLCRITADALIYAWCFRNKFYSSAITDTATAAMTAGSIAQSTALHHTDAEERMASCCCRTRWREKKASPPQGPQASLDATVQLCDNLKGWSAKDDITFATTAVVTNTAEVFMLSVGWLTARAITSRCHLLFSQRPYSDRLA
jgi:hypothetical protein